MLADERLQLTHDLSVASQGQVGIDPVGDGRDPQLVQPPDRGLGKRLVTDIGEGRTAPHAQRTAQRARGVGGLIAGELGPAACASVSNRSASTQPAGSLSEYPPATPATTSGAGSASGPALPASARRSRETASWRALRGSFGGRAGHSASVATSEDTTSSRRVSSSASSVSGRPPGDLEPRSGRRTCLDRAEQADVDVSGRHGGALKKGERPYRGIRTRQTER